jgi:hypothetical protein
MSFTRTVEKPGIIQYADYSGVTAERNWTSPTLYEVMAPGSTTSFISSEGFSDVEIANFHARRAAGDIFNNPFHKWKSSTIVNTSGELDLLFTGWYLRPTWFHSLAGKPNPPVASISSISHHPDTQDLADELKQKAVPKAWSRVNDASAELLASIAEGADTINFVASKLFRAVKILRALKRLDLKQVRNEITPIDYSKAYLEYRYALRPLIGEVQGALEAMNRKYSSPRMTRGWRLVESLPTTVTEGSGSHTLNINSLSGYTIHETVSTTTEVSVGAGILFEVKSTGVNSWGLDQVVQTAWEVVPFSFIVDWFCNLADIIGAHSPKLNTLPLANWCTVQKSTVVSRTIYYGGQSSIKYGAFVNDPGLCTRFNTPTYTVQSVLTEKDRIPDPEIPWLPSWDVNLDVLKLLDLAAILKSFRGSIR